MNGIALPRLEVCLSPALLHLYDTNDAVVVVIDVFRATSTIVAALHNGAEKVVPVSSVAGAIELGNALPGSITAGERDGKIAEGLQHGNSPLEYPPSFIAGKTLVLTTTNGTRLLHMVTNPAEIVIGSFLNVDAVSAYITQAGKNVLLACASWKDKFNLEDTLFAGAVVSRVGASFAINCDSARCARFMYEQSREQGNMPFLRDSAHFLRLSAYGLEADMAYCAQENVHPVVPVLKDGVLVKASM
ncbi:MAG: 2-phosphosulfolactate phosphatase [Chitinophagia bacterium]|nr:2-phosphosulfolactate phosphatase [Chitinophagia bacterium]